MPVYASTFGVEPDLVPGHYLGPLGGLDSSAGLQRPLQLGAPTSTSASPGNGGGHGSARLLLPLQHAQWSMASPRAPRCHDAPHVELSGIGRILEEP